MGTNFLSLRLNDNDFAMPLADALKHLAERQGLEALRDLDPIAAQPAIADLVAAMSRCRRFDVTSSSAAYIAAKLRIIRPEHTPTWDSDYGTASIDLSTGYIWNH